MFAIHGRIRATIAGIIEHGGFSVAIIVNAHRSTPAGAESEVQELASKLPVGDVLVLALVVILPLVRNLPGIVLLHKGENLVDPAVILFRSDGRVRLGIIRKRSWISVHVPVLAAVRKNLADVVVVVEGEPHLLEVVRAAYTVGCFAHLLHGR